tara:strand:+ start:10815 stop:11909 length:1095 start_codon:yes stop_codon:yes gene_type:complete
MLLISYNFIKLILSTLLFPKDTVTVLTLVYNGMPYLKESVQSILSQDVHQFRYLIIDDCSTDDSYHFLQSLSDKRITLIRNDQNIGVSNSFNKALEIIKTPLLIRMDQDDVSLPSRVREQAIEIFYNENIDFLCSWEHIINEQGKRITSVRKNINNYGQLLAPILLGLCPIWHPSLACRVSVLKKTGGFRDDYRRAEDYDVTARLILERKNAIICQDFHLNVRMHKKQQSNQYFKTQKRIASQIQEDSINYFLNNEYKSSKLAALYRRDVPISSLFRNGNISELIELNFELIDKVKNVSKLSFYEYKSFTNIIKKRIGLAVFVLRKQKKLPFLVKFIIFTLLSPQYFLFRAKKYLMNSQVKENL